MPHALLAAQLYFELTAQAIGGAIGLSGATSVAVANTALKLALLSGVSALAMPSIPQPESSGFNSKQARPPRRFAVGTCKVAGSYMLDEAKGNVLHRVIAFPEGPVGHWGRTWLNDDEVEIVDGVVQELADRYKTGLIRVQERQGAATETAYADLVTELAPLWTTNHRGDGVPSLWLRCQSGAQTVFQKNYPAGPPEATREAYYVAYDWRLDSTAGGSGSHRRDDETTWEETTNPVIWTVNIMWRRYGVDWDRRFAPALDVLTVEADVCDEAVALKAGGTIPRWEAGLWFEATTPLKTFLSAMLATMDGHFSVRRDGAYIIRAGHYYTPTVIFGEREIIDISYNPGPTPASVINVLVGSFADPANAYSKTDVEPWRDEASIAIHGERAQDFFVDGARSQSQLRRLEKAAMDRMASADGSFRTPLSARRGLGERYVGIRTPEEPDLEDAVVEILDRKVDLGSASITWTYKVVTSARYAWTAADEEGDPPDSQERPAPVSDPPPVITSVTPFLSSAGPAGDGVRMHIAGTGPDRSDLRWFVQWRSSGSTSWNIGEVSDEDATTVFAGDTGFVPADASLEVQLGYSTAAGTLTWSETANVETTTTNLLLLQDGAGLTLQDDSGVLLNG